MDNRLLRQLAKSRKNLKYKYKTLKSDILKSQSHLEKTYNPITKPIKELIATIEKTEPLTLKTEDFEVMRSTPKTELKKKYISKPKLKEKEVDISTTNFSETLPTNTYSETIYETGGDETLSEDSSTQHYIDESMQQLADMTRDENPVFSEYLEQFSELPRLYIKEGIRDTENQFDNRFGVYHDLENEKFSIGDSLIDFEGDDLKIKGVRYKGTPGLYELLFKNRPIGYSKNDSKEYYDILKRTNALYNRNNPKLPLQRATKLVKEKYESVIQPQLGRPRSGSAPNIQTRSLSRKLGGKMTLLNFNKDPIEYKYYDNINEIVDRLRILLASQSAGNYGHQNEIISVIEELREAKIIN